jgi:hypothetical protein
MPQWFERRAFVDTAIIGISLRGLPRSRLAERAMGPWSARVWKLRGRLGLCTKSESLGPSWLHFRCLEATKPVYEL